MGQKGTTRPGELPLFRNLPDSQSARLNDQLDGSARTVRSGHVLAERGTPMDHLFILLDGNAHAEIISGDGHAMIVENFHGPDVIATAMLFAPHPHFPVSLIADSACTYSRLHRNTLLDLCQKHRSVLEALLADAGRRTAFLASRLRLTQFASLRQRIAVYITEAKPRTDRNGVEYVYVPHSRQELADMFGVARPSLSRELGRMGDEGIIWASGSTIQIIDRSTLETLVTGCE
jgi:CRP/FNR family transcriptional regulator, dissimilatory nitrate respiration regulator